MRLKWRNLFPEGYKALRNLQDVAESGTLDPKLRELVKIRASQINKCAFCLDMHTKDALAIGETGQRINLLPAWREVPFYSPTEKAALAWCESLTLLPEEGASDEIFNELENLFDPVEIVELTYTIVTINNWNRFGVAFRSDAGNYISHKNPAVAENIR